MESIPIDNAVRVLLGLTVLLAGRNIFWLFIALIGFLAGWWSRVAGGVISNKKMYPAPIVRA